MLANNVVGRKLNTYPCNCGKIAQYKIGQDFLCEKCYNKFRKENKSKVVLVREDNSYEDLDIKSVIPAPKGHGLKSWGGFGKRNYKPCQPEILFGLAQELWYLWYLGEKKVVTLMGEKKYALFMKDTPDTGVIFTSDFIPVARFNKREIIEWFPYVREPIDDFFGKLLETIS